MNSIFPASILFAAGLAAGGPIYNVADLGTLGGASAAAFGLSSNGIAVGTAMDPYGNNHAFVNSKTGLVDLTANTNASQGIASGVNAAGQVAGTSYVNGQAYATIWMDSTTQSIAAAGSSAMAINNGGQVTGMLISDGHGHAFVTEGGVVTDLGMLPGGGWAAGYAINNVGEVAGYGQAGNGTFRGFVWSSQDGLSELGTLGGSNSYAMAINDAGEVAGNSQVFSGYAHAFLYVNGVMADLGTLGGGNSYAYGINSRGDVTGYSYVTGNDVTHAFLYENGVMMDLNTLINTPGWVITAAYAINDRNEIVGTGLLNGVEHAVLLRDPRAAGVTQGSSATTPEPGTAELAAIGLGLILLSRLRPIRRRTGRRREPRR